MSLPPAVEPPSSPSTPKGCALSLRIAAIIAEADRLANVTDGAGLTREAVEFARDTLGVERVSIFLSQPEPRHVVMRGTWGTNDAGRTANERGLAHACSHEDFRELRELHRRGALWEYRALEAHEIHRWRSPGTPDDRPWLAVTPLVAGGEVVGVMYNDTAITNAPLDCAKQTSLAVFGSLWAGLARERLVRPPATECQHVEARTSRFIERVLSELDREPQLTGDVLARRFRVSPGHLARTFRVEVGTSLVEYRNRLRLQRFFALVRQGPRNLLEAALEAGFGSYSQFHRVHRSVTGAAPSEYKAVGARQDR